jgi:tRNA(Arg) A34 adenosine deaminase TadA
VSDILSKEVLERDIEYYNKAVFLAHNGEHRVRVGCVAAHNGKILAGAFNTFRNSAKIVPHKAATYHAEHNTLNLIPDRLLSRCTIYIARIGLDGALMPSRPCVYCMAEIASESLKEIVYLSSKHRIVKEILR